jgi:NAD(P)-dependent dehydrogenase (short-subunit alcohol dehydrogenase family)
VIGIARRTPSFPHAPGRYIHFPVDLADRGRDHAKIETAARRIVADLGLDTVQILVNCSGVVTALPIAAMPAEAMDRMIGINLLAPMMLTRGFFRELAAGKGRILNVGSLSSRLMMPIMGGYGISKRALLSFTEVMRLEGRPFGIEACYVELGNVRTGIHSRTVAETRRILAQIDDLRLSRYREPIACATRRAEAMDTAAMATDRAAGKIMSLLEREHLPPVVTIGQDAWRRRIAAKLLPAIAQEYLMARALKLKKA